MRDMPRVQVGKRVIMEERTENTDQITPSLAGRETGEDNSAFNRKEILISKAIWGSIRDLDKC